MNRIDTESFEMLKSIHGGSWHIVRWVNSEPELERGRYFRLALCRNQRIRIGVYPDGTIPDRMHIDEVDFDRDPCVRCRQRYENIMVRRFREEIKEL